MLGPFCEAEVMAEIVSNSVLPANRQDIEFTAADGVKLVGELALPESVPPVATIICLHPLPTHGGYMDSHVFRKMAWRLPALADVAVLRFNFRGVESARGRSEGEFTAGPGEGLDAQAALQFAISERLPNIYVVGWSFGTDVTLRFMNQEPVKAGILLSPPLRWTNEADLDAWATSGRPLTAVVPEFDDFLQPEAALARFARVPQAKVITAEGAKHLWVGEKNVKFALNEIMKVVNPAIVPLPIEWDGPMERWSDL
jgi:alpha/beta superfamily hydrolase